MTRRVCGLFEKARKPGKKFPGFFVTPFRGGHTLIVSRDTVTAMHKGRRFRMRRYRGGMSGCCVAFGLGLLIASICPPQGILVIAALLLIVLGCSCVRGR